MLFKVIISFVCLTNVLSDESVDNNYVELKTTSGLVRGQTLKVLEQNVNQFLGIPFAEPPIGELRFAKTKALQKSIEGIIDGTTPKNSCMQLGFDKTQELNENLTMSEDCLVLNIWSAQPANSESTELKPVMFWIHGGALILNSIFRMPPYDGSILATQGVVLVSTNYRLGPFGLLYGGTDDAPGNLAFYDQLMAMNWVRDNIHLFGGDKNQITIFGEDAGSWSVSAHVLSPLSKGLFQRAIMQSGTDFHGRSYLTTSDALKQSKEMAKHFNCDEDEDWLNCLRNFDALHILNYTDIAAYPLDGTEFLPSLAQDALKGDLYSKDIDIIAGVTRNEGSLLAHWNFNIYNKNFTENEFKYLLKISNFIFHDLNEEKVFEFYTQNIDTTDMNAMRKAFSQFYGDITMNCPTYLFAKQFSENNHDRKTFFYEMTYQSEFATFHGCVEQTMGICHYSDVFFVFGNPIQYGMTSNLDTEFSQEVMKMWTNFAKTGDPGSDWPQLIDQDTSKVKDMNPNDLSAVFVDHFKKTCDEFWKDYFN